MSKSQSSTGKQSKPQAQPNKQQGSSQPQDRPTHVGVYECKASSKGGWSKGKYKGL